MFKVRLNIKIFRIMFKARNFQNEQGNSGMNMVTSLEKFLYANISYESAV
jgi:hypothetical protein